MIRLMLKPESHKQNYELLGEHNTWAGALKTLRVQRPAGTVLALDTETGELVFASINQVITEIVWDKGCGM